MRCWVEGADDPRGDFPIENLPLGAFRTGGEGPARLGIAIGASALDLHGCVEAGLLDSLGGEVRCALCASGLNDLLV